MKKYFVFIFLFGALTTFSQESFSRLDTLRGSVTPDRAWWDLTYYHLDINVDPDQKFISGSVTIQYEVIVPSESMQIDLQEPLSILKIVQKGKELSFSRFGPVYTVQLKKKQKIGKIEEVVVYYEGYPKEALRAPWDGGFSWEKDEKGRPFIATSCQGLGASVWWPCKDHMYDEVDSMLMSIEVPEDLVNVSNGRLREIDSNSDKKTKTYHWFVDNPINNYGVNVNIGNYVHWHEDYEGEKGKLDMDYWVLDYNEEKAKEQFKQAPMTIEAFEYWFGPYPFYEDGYKLVEVPYLGMEHQSSVTYGNNFKNGFNGSDMTKSGWGLKFDYIIIHESGHEWFANNITYKDIADMWVHESFTCYSESLYLEYWFGKTAGDEYNRGLRIGIENKNPMIGKYDVNKEGSDLYTKGANVLATIRQIVNDDEKWRSILRGLNEEFYHQTVQTYQIENYISDKAGIDLSSVFDQYLRDIRTPILEYFFDSGKLFYRWNNVVENFEMPVDIHLDDSTSRIHPTTSWQNIKSDAKKFSPQADYYIGVMKQR